MPNRRLGLLPLVSLTFLLVMFAIRLLLWAMTPPEAALSLPLLVKAAATGLFFDLATLSYALLPVALYLLLAPRRLVEARWHDWLIRCLFFAFAAVLLFDAAAEYFFFDEFGTRFNFIAVDYLIYTTEVIGNIRESYPLVPIFAAIGSGALLATWLLRQRLQQAASVTFGGRFRRTGALLLLPALVALAGVNVAQTAISSNNYANELAGNGIYNLVAAFRNNELSFTRFYRTAPQDQVLAQLRTLVAERNNRFVAPNSQRFTRQIAA